MRGVPSNQFILGVAMLLTSLIVACDSGPPGSPHTAYYRPVPMGFCPRYIIGGRHAWVTGKLAPGRERDNINDYEFVFDGYFETDENGVEKVRTSCDQRPYPIFHLKRVNSERRRAAGAPEPRLVSGPGSQRYGRSKTSGAQAPPTRAQPFRPITGPGEGKTLIKGPVDRASSDGHGLAPLPSLKPERRRRPNRRRGRRTRTRQP